MSDFARWNGNCPSERSHFIMYLTAVVIMQQLIIDITKTLSWNWAYFMWGLLEDNVVS